MKGKGWLFSQRLILGQTLTEAAREIGVEPSRYFKLESLLAEMTPDEWKKISVWVENAQKKLRGAGGNVDWAIVGHGGDLTLIGEKTNG